MSDTTTTAVTEPAADDRCASLPDGPVHDLGAVAGPDPYPVYARLRDAGVITAPEAHVSRYADVQAVLHHPDVSDARNNTAFGLLDPGFQRTLDTRSFVRTDPPDHTRLRRLVTKAFTRRRVEALRPYVQATVDAAIDAAAARGHLDVVADLAYPLPVQVICRLLGVPADDHLDLTERRQLCRFDPSTLAATPAVVEHMQRHRDDDLTYWASVIEARRAHPGDDLVSALIAARDDEDRLTDEELVNIVRLLFVGGHETTVSLIANGMLAAQPGPARPAPTPSRTGRRGGRGDASLRRAVPVRPPHRDRRPEHRRHHHPGRHPDHGLARRRRPRPPPVPRPGQLRHTPGEPGGGIHACMAGPLSRLQTAIALRTLTTRLAGLALAPDSPPVYHDDAVHALRSLPVTFADVRDDRPRLVEA